jgi:hypothetical protein
VFSEKNLRVDKRAQSEGTGKMCVFVGSFGSDGDVKVRDEEKTTRIMGWKARSELERSNSFMYDIQGGAAAAAPPDTTQFNAAFHPLSFNVAQANTVSYPTSSAAANAASHSLSFVAADAAGYAASSIATQASEAANAASSNAVQASA